jgi:cation:H+ antiporter
MTALLSATSLGLQLLLCGALIAYAGARLSRYADVIASRTGLSGSWIGLLLIAVVTSLPELVTGVSSVAIAGVPDIALGDALGSCTFNLMILAALGLRRESLAVLGRASQGHILSAASGVLMLTIVLLALSEPAQGVVPGILHISLVSPVLIGLYLVAARSVFTFEKRVLREATSRTGDRYPDLELSRAARGYAAFAALIVASGLALPFVAGQPAVSMGWSESFVGTQLVAVATSLPQIAVTLHAVRIGALMYRPTRRLWRGLDGPALSMLALYLANAWTAFGH